MTRQVVLDTETTGIDTADGHRIIEIGCLELVKRRPTGRTLHLYLNPCRDIDEGALRVHGLTPEFLADKPLFEAVADEVMAFLDGAELIIHNAPFDVGFLDSELARLGRGDRIKDHSTICDTLPMAKRLHPGQKNNLDALCRRYGVDNSKRELHGALLDAQLLADVYLLMTGGQSRLFQQQENTSGGAAGGGEQRRKAQRVTPQVIAASSDERQLHQDYLQAMAAKGAEVKWL